MHAILLCAGLVLGANANAPIEDGSLLLLRNGNKIIARATGSKISHVAMVMTFRGAAWVYEATPDKVRRVKLAAYYRQIGELNRDREQRIIVQLLRPKRPYSVPQRARMRTFLEAQIGRRYSVRGYLRRNVGDGIHCSALAASALRRTGRVDFERTFSESPASFVIHVRDIYQGPESVPIPIPPKAPRETWCAKSWKACVGLYDWCRWGVVEAFRFCF